MSGAEAVALTDALELDPQLLLELLEVGPLASDYAHAKAGAMLEHDFTPGFPLRHRLKDARLALAAARAASGELPLTTVIAIGGSQP